ncbi:esterase-like activity of phytase family protein [Mycobacterium botniense]|uniref:Phytase n=1 Tax=Mycobacterium botniense TaxID=84962 RepID=A0A7I9Y013_9MYCO|nr:phytase [Mycobacterium botniense]
MTPMSRLLVVCWLFVAGCAPAATVPPQPQLRYLGQVQVPHATTVDGTLVGGLSGISYDPGRHIYYVISDDRSEHGPARFYTVRLSLPDKSIDASRPPSAASGPARPDSAGTVEFIGAHPLLDESGHPFRPLSLDSSPPVVPPDPEGIAYDAVRQRLYWSSEGERITDGRAVLLDPWIRVAALDGSYLGQFRLPAGLAMSAAGTGPRRNRVLEGLTLTPDGKFVFAAMEQPGYHDGDPPNRSHGALTRITKFDVDTQAPVAQYAYPLEPAAAPADSNGLTDLVALSDTTFLVLERAESVAPAVRIFRADVGAATDVLALPSLTGTAVTPMRKALVADLSATVSPLDNIEGITVGPELPDGRRSVVLVSDDNFSPAQLTQFLFLAM